MAQRPANNTPAPEALDPVDEAALPATRPTQSFVPGTLDMEDTLVLTPSEFPILKIAAGMGEFGKEFELGSLGFMKPEVIELAPVGTPLDCLVVHARVYLKEYRKFVPNDKRPFREYPTKAAAAAAGERLEWTKSKIPGGDDLPPTVREAADLILLVATPAGLMTTAPQVELFGKLWIPIRFYADRNYFQHAARPIIRANAQQLKNLGGFTAALWTLTGSPYKAGSFDIHVGTIALKRLLTDEEKQEYHTLLTQFGSVTFDDVDPSEASAE